jgi:hypothetical protein
MAKREIPQLTSRRHFEHFPGVLSQRRETKARRPPYTYKEPNSDADDEEELPDDTMPPKPIQRSAYLDSPMIRFDDSVQNAFEGATQRINRDFNT